MIRPRSPFQHHAQVQVPIPLHWATATVFSWLLEHVDFVVDYAAGVPHHFWSVGNVLQETRRVASLHWTGHLASSRESDPVPGQSQAAPLVGPSTQLMLPPHYVNVQSTEMGHDRFKNLVLPIHTPRIRKQKKARGGVDSVFPLVFDRQWDSIYVDALLPGEVLGVPSIAEIGHSIIPTSSRQTLPTFFCGYSERHSRSFGLLSP